MSEHFRNHPNHGFWAYLRSVRAFLIIVISLAVSALAWGLFTGRWSADSRQARALRVSEAQVSSLMRVPVPWVFMLGYLIGLGFQVLFPVRAEQAHRSTLQVAGFVLLGIGLVLAASALGLFRKSGTTTVPFETPSKLVTSGPYLFTRNPMYVALTLIYLGVQGARLELWPLAVLPLILLYINYQVIPVEERRLGEIFGDSYRHYQSRVRRWF